MLPTPVRRIVEEIGNDAESGALPLAKRALAAYTLLEELSTGPSMAEELHSLLSRAQPWMAAVKNASLMGREIAASESWEDLGRLMTQLDQAQQRVADVAFALLRTCRSILTISYSSDVLAALKRRSEEGEGLVAYVCESRPLMEGAALARELKDAGLRSVLIADAAGPSLVASCDAVVTGADSLLRDGHLVNKIGTLGLYLACQEFDVPSYTLMEVLKVELEGSEVAWQEESRDPGELSDEVEALNFYFEKVPGRLVRSVATDAGVMDTFGVTERFRTVGDLVRFYLAGG